MRLHGAAQVPEIPSALAVDESRNVYVTGNSYREGAQLDFCTIMYDSSGNEVWVERYEGPVMGNDEATDLALDGFGNVCVTGFSEGGSTNYDFATIKYVESLRGDVNADQVINLGDAVYLLNYLFKGGPPPVPDVSVGDVNCDEAVDLGDAIYLLNYLFKDGPKPCSG